MAYNKDFFVCEATRYFMPSGAFATTSRLYTTHHVRCIPPWYHFVRVNLRLVVIVIVDLFDSPLVQHTEITSF